MTLLKNQAIQTALTGDWNTAIFLNQELLKENPEDIETLNRLAFAYIVIGKIKEAKQTYQKVLKIDYNNPIALKGLKKINGVAKDDHSISHAPLLKTNIMFIEENGKTKVIELVNVAEPHIIAHLMTAEMLELRIKRLKVFVLDTNNHYVGMVPENIGKRLIKLMRAGSIYETCVKAIEDHKVTVFIKELKKPSRFKNQPSFLPSDMSKHFSLRKNHAYKSDTEDFSAEEDEKPEVD